MAAESAPKETEALAAKSAPSPAVESKVEAKPDIKSTPAPAKGSVMGLAAGEEVVAPPSPKASSEEIPKKLSTSGKFVIQIGAFASEERAKGWISKMKEQKIPNYVINKTSSDGTKLYVLRAGPFTDKEVAEAAEKKVKAMGLTPRLVEVGAN
ncbi:MAG: hypothetical protein B7Z19_06520 [Polynucleobacter sp. 32-46-5]|nr:MAG: hypothetical protein B7Z19_06520 [Polynucleobacter sp. 32-46-5]